MFHVCREYDTREKDEQEWQNMQKPYGIKSGCRMSALNTCAEEKVNYTLERVTFLEDENWMRSKIKISPMVQCNAKGEWRKKKHRKDASKESGKRPNWSLLGTQTWILYQTVRKIVLKRERKTVEL